MSRGDIYYICQHMPEPKNRRTNMSRGDIYYIYQPMLKTEE